MQVHQIYCQAQSQLQLSWTELGCGTCSVAWAWVPYGLGYMQYGLGYLHYGLAYIQYGLGYIPPMKVPKL